MNKEVLRISKLLAISGIAGIAFGIAVFVWPGISLEALLALFGAFALLYGILILGIGLDLVAHRSSDWVPFTLNGLAGIAIGMATFLFPAITALTLVYLIAGWAIVTGVFEIAAAFDMREMVKDGWWIGLSGALSVVFGLLIAVNPGAGVLTILWLIGVYSILAGATRLAAGYRLHTFASNVNNVIGSVANAVGAARK
jgi:uncharacterized membrane protein HdeD (DUF308 family)